MGIAGGWTVSAKHCDTCKSATAAIFCRVDAAFLCFSCDAWIHRTDAKFPERHERVWLCEVCEQAPAFITCRADTATLCLSCDVDIHSANNLASRHERVPVEPFFDASEAIVRSASLGLTLPKANSEVCGELETVSWLLPNLNHGEAAQMKTAPSAVVDNHGYGLFLNEMESLLDLEFGNGGMDRFHSAAMDSLVPTHTMPATSLANTVNTQIGIDFCRSKLSCVSYLPPSLTQNVSSCSLDVGVVPEGVSSNTSADPSLTNTVSSFASHPTQSQLCGTDREARVLRYREKRKTRKFEKTIRYASRKAYAESRPRIKGRFAKRSEIDIDIDIESDNNHCFFSLASSAFTADTPYADGVVPTF